MGATTGVREDSENVHMAVPHVNFPVTETPVNFINGDGVMPIMADMNSAPSILRVNLGLYTYHSDTSRVTIE